MITLAQSRQIDPQFFLWLGVLIVAVIVAGVVVLVMRRRLFGGGGQEESGTMLEELRRMRDAGEISPMEFEEIRATMIAKATGKDPDDIRREFTRRAGGKVAEPGYDLTGAPLPGSAGDGTAG